MTSAAAHLELPGMLVSRRNDSVYRYMVVHILIHTNVSIKFLDGSSYQWESSPREVARVAPACGRALMPTG